MFGFDLPFWLLGFFTGARKIIGALFSFFSKPPGIYIAMAIAVAGAIWWSGERGYGRGVAWQKSEDEKARLIAVAAAEKRGRENQAKLDAGIQSAAEKAAYARGKAQSETITIIRKVPQYVTAKVDADFAVPCATIRLHNAATTGADPASESLPAGLLDGDTCPIKQSDFVATIVANYGIDREKDAQIDGLQDLVMTLARQLGGGKEPEITPAPPD